MFYRGLLNMLDLDKRDRWRLELLALQLLVHGPEAATAKVCRLLGRSPLWLEAKCLLRSHGFDESETALLLGLRHPRGCACWECVIVLNKAVRETRRLANRRR